MSVTPEDLRQRFGFNEPDEPSPDDLRQRFGLAAPRIETPGEVETPQEAEEEGFNSANMIRSLEGPAIALGSIVGTALGTPGGPVGMAAGGALGAAAGQQAFNVGEAFAREQGVEGLGPQPSLGEQVQGAVKEGVIDIGFSSGAKVFELAADALRGAKNFSSRASATPEGRELAAEALRMGVEPRRFNIGSNAATRFYSKVVARFPLAATPFRKRVAKSQGQIIGAGERLFMRMGPSWDMAQAGVRLDKAFTTQYKLFRRRANDMYGEAMTHARTNGTTADTAAVRQAAQESMERLSQGQLALGKSQKEIDRFFRTDPVGKRVAKYAGVGERLSLDQLNAIDELMDADLAFAASRGGELVSLMSNIKNSISEAGTRLDNPETLRLIKQADDFFSTTMREMFETPIAQKAGRVTKNRFQVGKFKKAGTRNPDESFKFLFNAESPEAMTQLRSVVGAERFGGALRTHVERIYQDSINAGVEQFMKGEKSIGMDFEAFKTRLGLDNPKSAKYQTLKRALQVSGSGVTIKNLEAFTNLLENTLRNAPDDVNTFIARRVTLAGSKAVTGLAGSIGLAALPVTIIARQAGKIIGRKTMMDAAGKLLSPDASFQVKRNALVSLDKMFRNEFGEPFMSPEEEALIREGTKNFKAL